MNKDIKTHIELIAKTAQKIEFINSVLMNLSTPAEDATPMNITVQMGNKQETFGWWEASSILRNGINDIKRIYIGVLERQAKELSEFITNGKYDNTDNKE